MFIDVLIFEFTFWSNKHFKHFIFPCYRTSTQHKILSNEAISGERFRLTCGENSMATPINFVSSRTDIVLKWGEQLSTEIYSGESPPKYPSGKLKPGWMDLKLWNYWVPPMQFPFRVISLYLYLTTSEIYSVHRTWYLHI